MSSYVPVADGLYGIEEGVARLIGTTCTDCGARYFPQTPSCRNPDCRDKRVAATPLPPCGVLASYTVQRYRPPALFRMDDWAPYAIGLVDLGEGLEVMGMLTGFDLAAITIGTPVETVVDALYRDDDGNVVGTYKFAPVASGDKA